MSKRRFLPGVSDHARERAALRLGRDLTREEWLAVVASILTGGAVMQGREPTGVEHYLVQVGAMPFRAVWNPATAVIVTVKDMEMEVCKAARLAKASKGRASLRIFAKWSRGKRLKGGTIWQDGR